MYVLRNWLWSLRWNTETAKRQQITPIWGFLSLSLEWTPYGPWSPQEAWSPWERAHPGNPRRTSCRTESYIFTSGCSAVESCWRNWVGIKTVIGRRVVLGWEGLNGDWKTGGVRLRRVDRWLEDGWRWVEKKGWRRQTREHSRGQTWSRCIIDLNGRVLVRCWSTLTLQWKMRVFLLTSSRFKISTLLLIYEILKQLMFL